MTVFLIQQNHCFSFSFSVKYAQTSAAEWFNFQMRGLTPPSLDGIRF